MSRRPPSREPFPLGFRVARRFVGPRLALVGDAAVVLHPFGGTRPQSWPSGCRRARRDRRRADAPCGLDPGTPEVLAEFERARRLGGSASGLGMDAMNRLFSNDVDAAARDSQLWVCGSSIARRPSSAIFIEEAGDARLKSAVLLRELGALIDRSRQRFSSPGKRPGLGQRAIGAFEEDAQVAGLAGIDLDVDGGAKAAHMRIGREKRAR